MRKKQRGFTLIELVIFIVVTGILASTILLSFVNALLKAPDTYKNNIAGETARQCIEWFVGQRKLNGYNSIATGTTVPTFCTAPGGYTIAVAVSATSINTDTHYKTITVTVSGDGGSTLTTLIGDY